jgi:hypothetical protein
VAVAGLDSHGRDHSAAASPASRGGGLERSSQHPRPQSRMRVFDTFVGTTTTTAVRTCTTRTRDDDFAAQLQYPLS